MTTDWDAATYDRISDPMLRLAGPVLTRLELRGDERVLDAGCGSGRVTELLLERVPAGSVVALDASPSMIEEARARLASAGGRVEFVVADLGGPPLPVGQVDAILSTATFHWVPDHDALFRNLAAVLRPGGQLAAQCGGAGNIATVAAAVADLGMAGAWHKNFATPEATLARLDASGFTDARAWLEPAPVELEPGEPLLTYLAKIPLKDVMPTIPEGERDAFVRAVADRLPGPVLDYVRLNLTARRAA
jgi:trans-aconitate 2-methyltransferase